MPSEAWARWVRSFEGPPRGPSDLEDFDLGALFALSPGERADAERALIARLDGRNDDPRVPKALAALRTPSALEALRRAAAQMYPSATRIAAAQAMGGTPDAVAALVDTLQRTTEPDVRALAVAALEPHTGNAVDDAILAALASEIDPTAVHALFGALLDRRKLRGFLSAPSPLATLSVRMTSPVRTLREEAHAELKRLLAELSAGRAPRDLGLGVAPESPAAAERFRDSVIGEGDVDIDALIAFRGADRRWAEDFLLMRLAKLDPRLPAALAWIGAARAIGPLEELRTQGTPDWQRACRDALDALRSAT